MLHRHNSSSQEEDQNFDGHYKKIQYNGSAFDSDNDESLNDYSESNEQSRKVQTKLKKRNASKNDLESQDKSRAIKKNRESAKISRLRKKEYQQVLELKVNELQNEINMRKNNIINTSDSILKKFQKTNQQKYKFLVQKMNISSRLLTISEELKNLRQQLEENLKKNLEQHDNAVKIQESQAMMESSNFFKNPKQEGTKSTRFKKKRGQVALEEERTKLYQTISEKQQLLQMTVKAYMYQFGVKGCLRSDIIERSKYEWLQNLKNIVQNPSNQLCQAVSQMKEGLNRLDNQSKLLDYHLRELKERVKDKYVVQFLLDREFFINNSAQTIYKNSQLKPTP